MGKKSVVTMLVIMTALSCFVPVNSSAKVCINKKKLELNQSESYTLKLKNCKGTIKWKTSDSKIVKVNKKGIITALRKGKATITAKVGKNRYKCIVKVKADIRKTNFAETEFSSKTEYPVVAGVPDKSGQTTPTGTPCPVETPRPDKPVPSVPPVVSEPEPTKEPFDLWDSNKPDIDYMPGELLLTFENDCPEYIKEEIFEKYGFVKVEDIFKGMYDYYLESGRDEAVCESLKRELGKSYEVYLAQDSESYLLETMEKLKSEAYVKYVDKNHICYPCYLD